MRAGVAGISNLIAVGVLLIGIGHLGAVVRRADISGRSVAVLVRIRARIARVAEPVVIGVLLKGIQCSGAIVDRTNVERNPGVARLVVIGVGTAIASVSDAVSIGIRLGRVERPRTIIRRTGICREPWVTISVAVRVRAEIEIVWHSVPVGIQQRSRVEKKKDGVNFTDQDEVLTSVRIDVVRDHVFGPLHCVEGATVIKGPITSTEMDGEIGRIRPGGVIIPPSRRPDCDIHPAVGVEVGRRDRKRPAGDGQVRPLSECPVPMAEKDCHTAEIDPRRRDGDDQVLLAVSVEIPLRHRRGREGSAIWRPPCRREGPITETDQHGDAVIVPDRDVNLAVTVVVSQHKAPGRSTDAKRSSRSECPIPVAQENRDEVGVAVDVVAFVRNGKIIVAVAIEVGHSNRIRPVRCREGQCRLERAVSIAEPYEDIVGTD